MCTTSQLTAALGGGDAGAGSLFRYLVLTNHSGTTCHLTGYPGLSMLDAGGKQIGAPADRQPPTPRWYCGPASRRATPSTPSTSRAAACPRRRSCGSTRRATPRRWTSREGDRLRRPVHRHPAHRGHYRQPGVLRTYRTGRGDRAPEDAGEVVALGVGAEGQTAHNLLARPELVINLPAPAQRPAVERLARLTGRTPCPCTSEAACCSSVTSSRPRTCDSSPRHWSGRPGSPSAPCKWRPVPPGSGPTSPAGS